MNTRAFVLLLSFLFCGKCFSQPPYDYYISNSGNDNNPGTPSQPRQTITATASLLKNFADSTGTVQVGLKSGDIFNDAQTIAFPIQLSTYYNVPGKKDFAILNGSDKFDTGWIKSDSGLNIYQQTLSYLNFQGQGVGSYNYVYPIEIDREMEKTAPITARRPMALAKSIADADTIPGSFYIPVTSENPVNIYLHPTDGNSPDSNSKYRYEVSVRNSAIYGYNNNNNRFENLWVRGYGAGYGLIPSGANAYCNNIIFGPGTGIHHICLKNGLINHSLFLPASKNMNFYAIVFYNTYGLGYRNFIKNAMFLDIFDPIYTHTSFADNTYASLNLDSVIAFGDIAMGDIFLSGSNTDSILVNNSYVNNYTSGYINYSGFCSFKNSCFKNVRNGITYSATPCQSYCDNIFIQTYYAGITLMKNNAVRITNSIIKTVTPANIPSISTFIKFSGDTSNYLYATNNIFISGLDSGLSSLAGTANTDSGLATSHDIWDNNVYIALKGNTIIWAVSNPATNNGHQYTADFGEWQRQSGQDKHSLFFDLSNDPRGLKAIFVDPDNGDYDLANTPEAAQVKALRAGMTNPITCFLQKPTYEQAANMVMNEKMLAINSCRQPCLYDSVRINYTFKPEVLNNRQIQLQWNIAEQQNTDYYELEKATGNIDFKVIDTIAVTTDSSYSFIDNIHLNNLYNYRLAIVGKNGTKCYSAIATVKTAANKHTLDIYPNPSTGRFMVAINNYTGPANIVISNAVGQTIAVQSSKLESGKPQPFNLSGKAKGLYILKVQTFDGTYLQKFIIE